MQAQTYLGHLQQAAVWALVAFASAAEHVQLPQTNMCEIVGCAGWAEIEVPGSHERPAHRVMAVVRVGKPTHIAATMAKLAWRTCPQS